ncbi:hypothetical protein IFM89_025879 [Coptis chinensis]|uniref:F-box domain-containing protein n=1 Tax=Coptis chinensis TaxID=261450 RepID=A0A835GZ60_9MAGN|nr:hypothetical protein IFM89_025879 [Coptis chinensis]
MDASASTLSCESKSVCEGCSSGVNEDRISNLPDHILHHILSLLPTKYAVGTSVLSTRWNYLWTSISSLDFCDTLLQSERTVCTDEHDMIFMNFVDRVLLHHDAAYIHKFSLLCRRNLDTYRVNAWISSVLRRKVRELDLLFYRRNESVFPRSLFTCQSLTTLTIQHSVVKIPPSSVFSCLKVLFFIDLKICSDEGILEVTFTCPKLEECNILECQWVKIKTVIVSASSLKALTISDYEDDVDDYEIKVYAKGLISLDLETKLSRELSLYNPSSVVVASIDIFEADINDRSSKLLRGICNVKDLLLTDTSIMALSRANLLHTFSDLKHLRVCLYTDEFAGEYLRELLCCLPNLETLCFMNELELCSFEEHGTIPGCVCSHLKSVEFREFYGSENELSWVKLLLNNGKALKKLTVISSSQLSEDPQRQMEVTKQLQMLPRESKCCVVEIS